MKPVQGPKCYIRKKTVSITMCHENVRTRLVCHVIHHPINYSESSFPVDW